MARAVATAALEEDTVVLGAVLMMAAVYARIPVTGWDFLRQVETRVAAHPTLTAQAKECPKKDECHNCGENGHRVRQHCLSLTFPLTQLRSKNQSPR